MKFHIMLLVLLLLICVTSSNAQGGGGGSGGNSSGSALAFTKVDTGSPPYVTMWSPRSGAGLTYISQNRAEFRCWNSFTNTSTWLTAIDYFVVYGGTTRVNGEDRALNDVWLGSENAQSWCFIAGRTEAGVVHPNSPITFTPVAQAAVAQRGYYIYNVGGLYQGVPTNEVWSAWAELQWTRVTDHAPWQARYGASIAIDARSYITLSGGISVNGAMDDLWLSMTNGASWIQLADHAVGYRSGAMIAIENTGFLMGGQDMSNNMFMNDVWVLGAQSSSYELVTHAPGWEARAGHGVFLSNRWSTNPGVFVIGGQGNGTKFFNDSQFMYHLLHRSFVSLFVCFMDYMMIVHS